MTLVEYWNVLRKRWILIAVLAAIGASAGFALAKSTSPTYRATSKVFVSAASGSSASDLVQGSTYTQNLVQSYAQLAAMPVVLQPVINRLGLDTTPRELARSVTAETPLDTVIIEISATSGDPATAARVANEISKQLPQVVETVSPSGRSRSSSAVNIETISPAVEPTYPVSPNTRRMTALGGAAGLGGGVVLALLLGLLDTRVRGKEDVEDVDAPVLGAIPSTRAHMGRHITMIHDPRGSKAEAYRRVRANYDFVASDAGSHAFVVTSALPGEGKSTTSINLALALAEQGRRVLLIDADLRKPSIAASTGLEGSAGLSTILIGRATVADVVQPWGAPTLDVITSGVIPPNPLQLLDSPHMRQLLEGLRSQYDIVILDSAPLLPVADASILAGRTDGAIVTVRAGSTRTRQLAEALDALQVAQAAVLGVIVTRTRRAKSGAYYGAASNPLSRASLPIPIGSRRRAS